MTTAAVADPKAREFLRNADPVLARPIFALDRPDVLLAGSYLFASEFEERR
jgi:hypothetical protein